MQWNRSTRRSRIRQTLQAKSVSLDAWITWHVEMKSVKSVSCYDGDSKIIRHDSQKCDESRTLQLRECKHAADEQIEAAAEFMTFHKKAAWTEFLA